jgi:hypothetical protein
MSKHNSQRVDEDKEFTVSTPGLVSFSKNIVEKVDVPKPTTQKVRLRIDSNYKVTGKNSGQSYLFTGAGSVQDVEETDVEFLLSLRRNKACCGGGGGNALFELAGE